jgi:hypothetical protein
MKQTNYEKSGIVFAHDPARLSTDFCKKTLVNLIHSNL